MRELQQLGYTTASRRGALWQDKHVTDHETVVRVTH